MNEPIEHIMFPLFVPADRPDRIAKALAAGADAIVIDLEDAVAQTAKVAAREGLAAAIKALPNSSLPILVRVNAAQTYWHEADLVACAKLPLAAIMLPKAETSDQVGTAARITGLSVLPLIESAIGLHAIFDIAHTATRLAFGSIDFAADIGSVHSRDALLMARTTLVLASRVAGLPAPIDGVSTAIHDAGAVEEDARHGASLGFGGKLLIHPAQVGPARRGFAPSESEIAWARKIVSTMAGSGAVAVDGAMVDAPVLLRATQILSRIT